MFQEFRLYALLACPDLGQIFPANQSRCHLHIRAKTLVVRHHQTTQLERTTLGEPFAATFISDSSVTTIAVTTTFVFGAPLSLPRSFDGARPLTYPSATV
jgi:hypothetical protein